MPHSFETLAIHAGQEPDPSTGAITPPIHMTSTYAQPALGKNKGWVYSRGGNPTRENLETCLAALEKGAGCCAFGSGMAAITALLQTLKPGDGVVAGLDLYGGTHRILETLFRPWGVEIVYTPDATPEGYRDALAHTANPRLAWVESPTNPLLNISDIAAISAVVHEHGECNVVVDNTFATPWLQRPIELGADYVIHSTSKYLAGHSDVVGGVIVAKTNELLDPVKRMQKSAGAIPSPFDVWLTQRGVKSLAVRMQRHCDNALALAQALQAMPEFTRVVYPGLPDHPHHEIARKQMDGFGGVVTVEMRDGFPAVERLLERLEIFTLAEGLGGIESMVNFPPRMSHESLSEEELAERGITQSTVRFSVGIENIDDLIRDIRQAAG